jgi:peroxiredoxin
MRNYAVLAIIVAFFCSCQGPVDTTKLNAGMWQAKLSVLDGQKLPFNFKVIDSMDGTQRLEIYNANEVIKVDEIQYKGDSIRIQAPVFEGYILGKYNETKIEGSFVIESLDRVVPFEATYGVSDRFIDVSPSNQNISGVWEMDFESNTGNQYKGKGVFNQDNNKVTGTIRTNTGDYRYLEGVMDGDSLKISAFDGAHAFLFTAKATDSSLVGNFYAGRHSKEAFTAARNVLFELQNSDSLTFLKEGYDRMEFTFPDSQGNMVSLNDAQFKDKVVILQIMGTWCPNCLDETKFLVEYLEKHNPENLAVLGLAFESAKTEDKAFAGIQRLVNRVGVGYPILLAQYGSYDKEMAQAKLPMLNHVLSYPTTIYLDKKGKVRKIHTGFNGPATGQKYEEFKNEFEAFVSQLLNE